MQTTAHSVNHQGGGNFDVDGQTFVIGRAVQDASGLHHPVLNLHGQRAGTFDYLSGHWFVAFNYSISGSRLGGALAPDAAAALFDLWRAYGFPTE